MDTPGIHEVILGSHWDELFKFFNSYALTCMLLHWHFFFKKNIYLLERVCERERVHEQRGGVERGEGADSPLSRELLQDSGIMT